MAIQYPPGNDISELEKMKRAKELLSDESARKAVLLVARMNPAMGMLMQRIIEDCEVITDEELSSDSDEYLDLQKVGTELYDIGGYLLMQLTCNHLAEMHTRPERQTPKGNPYQIASLCNGAWNGIGEWVF